MIAIEEIKKLILEAMPGAEVEVYDRTGSLDHFRLEVTYSGFQDKSILEQHRMVHASLQAVKDAGQIHAVEIKTSTS